MTLEEALKKAAHKIWNELVPLPNDNDFRIYDIREEALTTMALRTLYYSRCTQIEKIKMISAHEEYVRGYDFELVIGSKSKGRYVRMFIQAKRLFEKRISGQYNSLHTGGNQTDALLQYSKLKGSLGMYAFFNNLQETNPRLLNLYNSSTDFDKRSMGITIASAYSVKMIGTNYFSDYHFNNGVRVRPSLYSLRNFPDLFYFNSGSRNNLAVPFHELSFFTIEMAELINKLYRRIQLRPGNRLGYYYFFPPGLEKWFDGKDLIPILNKSIKELEMDFEKRERTKFYNPMALIIVNTDK